MILAAIAGCTWLSKSRSQGYYVRATERDGRERLKVTRDYNSPALNRIDDVGVFPLVQSNQYPSECHNILSNEMEHGEFSAPGGSNALEAAPVGNHGKGYFDYEPETFIRQNKTLYEHLIHNLNEADKVAGKERPTAIIASYPLMAMDMAQDLLSRMDSNNPKNARIAFLNDPQIEEYRAEVQRLYGQAKSKALTYNMRYASSQVQLQDITRKLTTETRTLEIQRRKRSHIDLIRRYCSDPEMSQQLQAEIGKIYDNAIH